MYADDLVLLSDNPVVLRKLIQALETYCETNNLVLNIDKTKTVKIHFYPFKLF